MSTSNNINNNMNHNELDINDLKSNYSNDDMNERSQELTVFVQDMLDKMQTRFDEVGTSIIGRMDAVGKRMDDLERSITDLMEQAGLDLPPTDDASGTPSSSPMHHHSTQQKGSPIKNPTKESAVL